MSAVELLPAPAADARDAEAELLLRHYLPSDRLTAVVHRPAPALDGRSLYELAVEDPGRLLVAVRSMFDLHQADQ